MRASPLLGMIGSPLRYRTSFSRMHLARRQLLQLLHLHAIHHQGMHQLWIRPASGHILSLHMDPALPSNCDSQHLLCIWKQ